MNDINAQIRMYGLGAMAFAILGTLTGLLFATQTRVLGSDTSPWLVFVVVFGLVMALWATLRTETNSFDLFSIATISMTLPGVVLGALLDESALVSALVSLVAAFGFGLWVLGVYHVIRQRFDPVTNYSDTVFYGRNFVLVGIYYIVVALIMPFRFL
ncbi:hypothetical protein [Marinivivus vitaminiproducens]|uniref:hypothetical protein n=1 Tax=Marinivivus vitaminiproducens TaxID=3035935 RepID=UPI002798EDA8|nr:hypothetical protein P4R82_24815 [Geminicoccaceae bacterium SCSIO 64248]